MFVSAEIYDDIEAVANGYPDAVTIIDVDGGWMVFSSASDFETWEGQR